MAAVATRFWARVDKRGADECWPWLGACNRDGYGRFSFDDADHIASRVAYELTNGPLPPGQCALHSCDNPPCCNPAHLFAGTKGDNRADSAAKGRLPKGAANGNAKLDDRRVLMLRECVASGVSKSEAARRFRVDKTLVGRICAGVLWKHVGGPLTELSR